MSSVEPPSASVIRYLQYMNFVQELAARDVAQCIEAVGLDALMKKSAKNKLQRPSKTMPENVSTPVPRSALKTTRDVPLASTPFTGGERSHFVDTFSSSATTTKKKTSFKPNPYHFSRRNQRGKQKTESQAIETETNPLQQVNETTAQRQNNAPHASNSVDSSVVVNVVLDVLKKHRTDLVVKRERELQKPQTKSANRFTTITEDTADATPPPEETENHHASPRFDETGTQTPPPAESNSNESPQPQRRAGGGGSRRPGPSGVSPPRRVHSSLAQRPPDLRDRIIAQFVSMVRDQQQQRAMPRPEATDSAAQVNQGRHAEPPHPHLDTVAIGQTVSMSPAERREMLHANVATSPQTGGPHVSFAQTDVCTSPLSPQPTSGTEKVFSTILTNNAAVVPSPTSSVDFDELATRLHAIDEGQSALLARMMATLQTATSTLNELETTTHNHSVVADDVRSDRSQSTYSTNEATVSETEEHVHTVVPTSTVAPHRLRNLAAYRRDRHQYQAVCADNVKCSWRQQVVTANTLSGHLFKALQTDLSAEIEKFCDGFIEDMIVEELS
eukprot:PhM_4_TR15476/c0_g1_i1/m.86747